MFEMSEEVGAKKGSALKAMVSFFTIWQQDITQEDMDAMEKDFHLAPLVGLFFGAVLVALMAVMTVLHLSYGFGSPMIYAIFCLATVWIGSKFIHFDGLTDFGDGMIVSGAREDHVRALKDTLVGAGGIGVAITVVLLSFSAYSFAALSLIVLAPLVEVLVKNAMVVAAAFGEPGNGMAGRQVAMTTNDSAVRSIVLTLVLGIVLAFATLAVQEWILGLYGKPAYLEWEGVLAAFFIGLAASVAVGHIMASKANSTFGMVNGDILGATNEICRPVAMIVMALVLCVW